MSNPFSFYFHDYETFGLHPALDRPVQFAGIRTDHNLNLLDTEPLVVYCQPADDYLPQPEAVLTTGITPQLALQKGVCEAKFAQLIHAEFSEPDTCIVGYNNIRFDDEVTRHLFYRNFYDPYAYSWQNRNSRWDLLDVVRACYALRPDGINWPLNEDGLPSFRLEHLTAANQIEHQHAHDAMSDVYATIAIAKLIQQKQPKLFSYLFNLRHKKQVAELIDIANLTPLVHVSGMFGAYRGNTSWIAPLIWHPQQSNAVVVCDLMGDVSALLDYSVEQLHQLLYTKSSELTPEQVRIPLKLVHTNKCPVLAPAKTLLPENAARLQIDRQRCLNNLAFLKQHQTELQEKLHQLYQIDAAYPPQTDVDAQLYQGFLDQDSRLLCQQIRQSDPAMLANLAPHFSDPRLKELFLRYKARNYPHILTAGEQQLWQDLRAERLNPHKITAYQHHLQQLSLQYQADAEKLQLLQSLVHYCHYLLTK